MVGEESIAFGDSFPERFHIVIGETTADLVLETRYIVVRKTQVFERVEATDFGTIFLVTAVMKYANVAALFMLTCSAAVDTVHSVVRGGLWASVSWLTECTRFNHLEFCLARF